MLPSQQSEWIWIRPHWLLKMNSENNLTVQYIVTRVTDETVA